MSSARGRAIASRTAPAVISVQHHARDDLPLERAPVRQPAEHLPRDRLAFAVGVGGEDQTVGIGERRADGPKRPRGTLARGLVDQREAVLGPHRARPRRQVPHMAVAGEHAVAGAEHPADRPRLGRRFDDHDLRRAPGARGLPAPRRRAGDPLDRFPSRSRPPAPRAVSNPRRTAFISAGRSKMKMPLVSEFHGRNGMRRRAAGAPPRRRARAGPAVPPPPGPGRCHRPRRRHPGNRPAVIDPKRPGRRTSVPGHHPPDSAFGTAGALHCMRAPSLPRCGWRRCRPRCATEGGMGGLDRAHRGRRRLVGSFLRSPFQGRQASP